MPRQAPARPRGGAAHGTVVRLAVWYNAWYVGTIVEINKRRTKSENVSVAFNDEMYGETRGMIVADPDTYGADRLWCILRPIPIVLDNDDDSSEPPELPTTDDDAGEDD